MSRIKARMSLKPPRSKWETATLCATWCKKYKPYIGCCFVLKLATCLVKVACPDANNYFRERPLNKPRGGGIFPWAGIFFSQHTGAEKFFSGVYGANIFFYKFYNRNFQRVEPDVFLIAALGLVVLFRFVFFLASSRGREFFSKQNPAPLLI